MNDILHLECPSCDFVFPVTVYEGPCEGIDFSVDDAPLSVISEINAESNKGKITCTKCGCDTHLCVRFIAYPRPLSMKWKRKWRMY